MSKLHLDVALILRLMVKTYARGYNYSFGHVQEKLREIDTAINKLDKPEYQGVK